MKSPSYRQSILYAQAIEHEADGSVLVSHADLDQAVLIESGIKN